MINAVVYNLRNFMIITTLTMQATPIKAPITIPMNITARIHTDRTPYTRHGHYFTVPATPARFVLEAL